MLFGGGGPAELEPAVVLDGIELHRVQIDDAAVILTDVRSEIVFSVIFRVTNRTGPKF